MAPTWREALFGGLSAECNFQLAGDAFCNRPTVVGAVCDQHATYRCAVCGVQGMRHCGDGAWGACFEVLCLSCICATEHEQ